MKLLLRAYLLSLVLSFFQLAHAEDKKPQVDFIYFGDASCINCRGWRQADLPKLRKEAIFAKITFTEIAKSIDSGIPNASSFPAHLAPIRDEISGAFKGRTDSPMFVIVANGKVVWHMLGAPNNPEVIEALTNAVATAAGN